MATANPPQGAQAALRAIRLLKLFTAATPELSLTEICEHAGLNKTTAHRLLQALSSEAMVERDGTHGTYRLGAGMMALGVQALSSSDLRIRVRPMLKRLARDSGETATLEVPIDNSMLILDEVAGSHFVGAAGNVGTRWPLHATSTGKALVAFDEQVRARLADDLPSLTPSTIVRRADLEKQLTAIRHRGFAESVDELEDGFSGVGTVIRGGLGEVLGTLSICGPTQRMGDTRRARLGETLRNAAAQLQPA
ncbi:MAG: IclR family transcriptional regulator [Woeseiaceae bacterium]